MTNNNSPDTLYWEHAAAMMPFTSQHEPCPQGVLVPDTLHNCDHVAVVYEKGQTPPEITIREVSASVHTVLANGVAVAVVARADGPVLSAGDVLLVERTI